MCHQLHETWAEQYPMVKVEKLLVKLRSLISLDECSPIHILHNCGVLSKLVECLGENFDPFRVIQNEALWILINMLTSPSLEIIEAIKNSGFNKALFRLFALQQNLHLGENVSFCKFSSSGVFRTLCRWMKNPLITTSKTGLWIAFIFWSSNVNPTSSSIMSSPLLSGRYSQFAK